MTPGAKLGSTRGLVRMEGTYNPAGEVDTPANREGRANVASALAPTPVAPFGATMGPPAP